MHFNDREYSNSGGGGSSSIQAGVKINLKHKWSASEPQICCLCMLCKHCGSSRAFIRNQATKVSDYDRALQFQFNSKFIGSRLVVFSEAYLTVENGQKWACIIAFSIEFIQCIWYGSVCLSLKNEKLNYDSILELVLYVWHILSVIWLR